MTIAVDDREEWLVHLPGEWENEVNEHTPSMDTWFRKRTEAYSANPHNRAEAHSLMRYVKRNPLVICLATNFDIVALSRASELVGE